MTLSNKKIKIFLLVLLYLSLPLVIFLTNPNKLPLPLLILPVLLLFFIIYTTIYIILTKRFNKSRLISKTRMIVISGIAAIMPVLLLVLASIRQFTFRDIVLALALVICVSWYLLKVDFLKTS